MLDLVRFGQRQIGQEPAHVLKRFLGVLVGDRPEQMLDALRAGVLILNHRPARKRPAVQCEAQSRQRLVRPVRAAVAFERDPKGRKLSRACRASAANQARFRGEVRVVGRSDVKRRNCDAPVTTLVQIFRVDRAERGRASRACDGQDGAVKGCDGGFSVHGDCPWLERCRAARKIAQRGFSVSAG